MMCGKETAAAPFTLSDLTMGKTVTVYGGALFLVNAEVFTCA